MLVGRTESLTSPVVKRLGACLRRGPLQEDSSLTFLADGQDFKVLHFFGFCFFVSLLTVGYCSHRLRGEEYHCGFERF